MYRRYGRLSSLPALLVSVLTPFVSSEARAQVPPNDKCPGAEVIPAAGPFPYLTTLVPDIRLATTTSDPRPSCVDSMTRGIWYSFRPAVTAEYRISTCNPPTGTTVYDTVLGIFSSSTGTCAGTLSEIAGGCGDDECEKRSAMSVTLNAGTTYYIIAAKWGAGAPPVGEAAMQLEVTKAPENDTCSSVLNLPLNRTVQASLTLATNDFEVSTFGPNCYTLPLASPPIGQPSSPSAASGRDVVYSFTAPADGSYTFKAQSTMSGGNVVLHVAETCPTGTGPHTLTDCLGASNRNGNSAAHYAAEEVNCVPLSAGQKVYVYVDEAAPATLGARYALEATVCDREFEPNDDPSQGAPLSCGLVGSIFPGAFDEDFYSLGAPPAGTRVFAMADGIAGNDVDFDMRVVTETDTLEYDDSNNATPWGDGSPNIAGCQLTGTPSFLKMNHFSAMTDAEPYHLYSVLQPPGVGLGGSSATPESEPNGTIANATTAGNLFFSGTISTGGESGDRDLFRFCADEGDIIYLSADGDPLRNETPLDPALFLLDNLGNRLISWSDLGNLSISTPSPNTLAGTSPRSPGEALLYRAPYSGLYYAGINTEFAGEAYGTGDYLYSIALNCVAGSNLQPDLGITIMDTPDPIHSDEPLNLNIEVVNQGSNTALDAKWSMAIPNDTTFMKITAPPEWTCNVGSSNIECTTTCFPKASSASFIVELHTKVCILPGTMVHAATITSKSPDANATNDTVVATTEIVDGGTCSDGDVCTAADACLMGVCFGGPPNDCDDNNVCTDQTCVPSVGCVYTNNTNTCDDNSVCTTADKCVAGQCVGGPPIDCTDGDVCTDDLCDSIIGCMPTFNTAPCEDGDPCTVNDTCSSGTCITGGPKICSPLNDCQNPGVCNPETGECAYYLKPDGTPCNDGNACSTNDTCKDGACIESTPIVCPPPPDTCHGPGTCDPSVGACKYPILGGDLDGDGDGDECDPDIDGDGISNEDEISFGTNPKSNDSDGDNIDDCTEACPENDNSCFDGSICDVDKPANTDGDDSIDALDSDSDNDGTSDAIEAGDEDLSTPPADVNGDGIPDYRDPNIGGNDVILTGGCGCVTAIGEKNAPMTGLGLGVLGFLARRWRRARRPAPAKR